MISIKATVSELEKLEKLQASTLAAYRGAFRHLRQYAVELDSQSLKRHQENLDAIAKRLNCELSVEGMADIDSSLRCELRAYHDACGEFLAHLRKEFNENARVLDELTAAMEETDLDGSRRLASELADLHRLADSIEIEPVSISLRSAAVRLQNCITEIEKQHRNQLLQLTTEVQALHKYIETLRSDLAKPDEAFCVHGRFETESRIEGYLTDGRNFSIIAFSLRNLGLIKAQQGESAGVELFNAFAKRLKNQLESGAYVGSWADQQIVIVLAISKTEAITRSKELMKALADTYVHPKSGGVRRVELQAESAVMECAAGESVTMVLRRLEKLWEVMA